MAHKQSLGSTSISNMAHKQTTSSASARFPFFRLPRELRDQIYGIFTRNGVLRIEACFRDIEYAASESGPLCALRLVNKQVKQEYEEEMARSTLTKVIITRYSSSEKDFYATVSEHAKLGKVPHLKTQASPSTVKLVKLESREGHFRMQSGYERDVEQLMVLFPSVESIRFIFPHVNPFTLGWLLQDEAHLNTLSIGEHRLRISQMRDMPTIPMTVVLEHGTLARLSFE